MAFAGPTRTKQILERLAALEARTDGASESEALKLAEELKSSAPTEPQKVQAAKSLAAHPKACLVFLSYALEGASSPAEFNELVGAVSPAADEFYKGGQRGIDLYRQRIGDETFKGLHWELGKVLEGAVARFNRFELQPEQATTFATELEKRSKISPAAELRYTAAFHNVRTADEIIDAFRWAQRKAPTWVDPIFNRGRANWIARFMALEPPPTMNQHIRLIGELFRDPALQDQMWAGALRAASSAPEYLEGAKRLGVDAVVGSLDHFVSLKPTADEVKALEDLFPKEWGYRGKVEAAVSGKPADGAPHPWVSALCRFASKVIAWGE